MKQNIIIVLLTAICGLLGWVGAQVYEERQRLKVSKRCRSRSRKRRSSLTARWWKQI